MVIGHQTDTAGDSSPITTAQRYLDSNGVANATLTSGSSNAYLDGTFDGRTLINHGMTPEYLWGSSIVCQDTRLFYNPQGSVIGSALLPSTLDKGLPPAMNVSYTPHTNPSDPVYWMSGADIDTGGNGVSSIPEGSPLGQP